MALTPGTRLGVYEVTAQIGEGGMGHFDGADFQAAAANLVAELKNRPIAP